MTRPTGRSQTRQRLSVGHSTQHNCAMAQEERERNEKERNKKDEVGGGWDKHTDG